MPAVDPEKIIQGVLLQAQPGQEAFFLTEKGEEQRVRGDLDVALACFDRALRHDVALASAWVGRSRVLSAKQRDNEALGCVNRALDVDDKYVPALVQKGEIMRGRGRHEEALALYDAALASGGGADAKGGRAAVLKALGRSEAPAKSERKSIRRAEDPLVQRKSDPSLALGSGASQSVPPKRPSVSIPAPGSGSRRSVTQADDIATLDEVRTLFLATRHVEAFRKLEPLAQRLSSAREPWLLRAQILFAIGRHDAALASAERVLKIDARDVDALVLAVRAHAAMGKDVKALEVMERLMMFAAPTVDLLRLHGDCLVAVIRQADAVAVYRKALELAPDDGRAHLALGKTLRQLRRANEARAALVRAQEIAQATGDATLGALARETISKLPPSGH